MTQLAPLEEQFLYDEVEAEVRATDTQTDKQTDRETDRQTDRYILAYDTPLPILTVVQLA